MKNSGSICSKRRNGENFERARGMNRKQRGKDQDNHTVG